MSQPAYDIPEGFDQVFLRIDAFFAGLIASVVVYLNVRFMGVVAGAPSAGVERLAQEVAAEAFRREHAVRGVPL